MSEKDNGGPAFPVDFDYQVFEPRTAIEAKRLMSGMTLRDYFAAKAMPACYAGAMLEFGRSGFPDENWREGVAVDAYKMADAMLAARNN